MAETSNTESQSVLEPIVDPGFVATPYVKQLADFALTYLKADLPVHFSGPAGTGKTALALYIAAQRKRPIVLMHGDEEFKTADLVGAEYGFRLKRTRDQYIHSVTKVEEDVVKRWTDNRLTVACKYGFTLIYDEFTRSRPEANNVLLAILEEKMLDLPPTGTDENYLQVHPEFRAIFTSNPAEYAGVYTAQDALRNRLLTIDVGHFDEETEVAIVKSRSGIAEADAKRIVKLVRAFRKEGQGFYKYIPTVRESVKIARALRARKLKPSKKDPFFRILCLHVLTNEVHPTDLKQAKSTKSGQLLFKLINRYG